MGGGRAERETLAGRFSQTRERRGASKIGAWPEFRNSFHMPAALRRRPGARTAAPLEPGPGLCQGRDGAGGFQTAVTAGLQEGQVPSWPGRWARTRAFTVTHTPLPPAWTGRPLAPSGPGLRLGRLSPAGPASLATPGCMASAHSHGMRWLLGRRKRRENPPSLRGRKRPTKQPHKTRSRGAMRETKRGRDHLTRAFSRPDCFLAASHVCTERGEPVGRF